MNSHLLLFRQTLTHDQECKPLSPLAAPLFTKGNGGVGAANCWSVDGLNRFNRWWKKVSQDRIDDDNFDNEFQQQLDQASIETNKQFQQGRTLKEPMVVFNDLGGHNFEDVQNNDTVQSEL